MNDQETIDRIYKWADKKRQKYQYEYQMSGSPSAMKTFERYDDICDICLKAETGNKSEGEIRTDIRKAQRQIMDSYFEMKKVTPANHAFTFKDIETWMEKMLVY